MLRGGRSGVGLRARVPALLAVLLILLLVVTLSPPVSAQDDGGSPPPIAGGPSRELLVSRLESDFTGGHVTTHARLVMLNTEGELRELAADARGPAAWSPDGSTIAYLGQDGLRLVRPDGGPVPGALANDSTPSAGVSLGDQPWSPDSSRLLLETGPPEDRDLTIVDVASGQRTTVATDLGHASSSSWSPDGRRVAFIRFEAEVPSLWVVDLQTGEPMRLAADVVPAIHPPKWSPDGTELALDAEDAEGTLVVTVVDVATGVVRRPAGPPPTSAVHWSPLGDELVYEAADQTYIADARSQAAARPIGAIGTPHGYVSPTIILTTKSFPELPDVVIQLDLQTGQSSYHPPVGGGTTFPPTVRIDPGAPGLPLSPSVSRALRYSRMLPDGGAPRVLLGTSADFADALASGGAQGALDAPLLLAEPGGGLHEAVLDELRRLGTMHLTLLGGTAALSQAFEDDLRGIEGFAVDRLAGPTRIDTAVEVARATRPTPSRALLARAFGIDSDPTAAFADSLAGGAAAVAADAPLLLTERDRLSPQVAAWLEETPSVAEVVVLGGPAAIDPVVVGALESRGISVLRLEGPERIATAAAVTAWAREVTASDDDPPPSDGLLVVLDAFDPLAWTEGFAGALAADPSRGGGIVLVNNELDIHPASAAAGTILDAPASTSLVCGQLLPVASCFYARGVHGAAHSTDRATAQLSGPDPEVFGDYVVQDGGGAQCTVVTLEGAQIQSATVGHPSSDVAPGVDGRVIFCTRDIFRLRPENLDGQQVRVTTTDGQELTGTLTFTGPTA